MHVLMTLLSSIQNRGQPVVEAQYLSTGRLTSLTYTINKLFKFFLTILSSINTDNKNLKSYDNENDKKLEELDKKTKELKSNRNSKELYDKNENNFLNSKFENKLSMKFIPNSNLLPNSNSTYSIKIVGKISAHFIPIDMSISL